ncbi:asparagine synthase (glutamine-hydrolyzing) [Chlorobium phaeovibrioides]|uniref:asparagine synthase (glutamine-hydrolyzing) n=1 Tax=Chlorobium phaeovibrioides TaxID=1094 RepID=A0A3S0LPZ2_CHLPH|nr:asparagine synthase (glutamine-hydrolyzing) [Chlorobium phaeovibrioides]RTY38368.1 asparagine synthase (glutamine-hydrolyzing) [Chlorobium phaeovibrioides]
MCGIAGFFDPAGFNADEAAATANRMANAIRHRGPDDSGVWVDAEAGIALAHRRLSVLDLSPSGHQPMHSRSGRYAITYNGEIYNHHDLKKELERASSSAMQWAGHSDTEVLLACVERWGIEDTLKRLTGMFAFALWDRASRTLTLARDRMGEKPLYYGLQNGIVLFGSELKALKPHPAFQGVIDSGAVAMQLRYSSIPAPHSIYRRVWKLMPGTRLSLHGVGTGATELPEPIPYWSLRAVIAEAAGNSFIVDEVEAALQLEGLLTDAVGRQMESDVPLGAFLSGGIDSSTIVALMQAQARGPVKTFTVGFQEQAFNEAHHAKDVARHLGTDHTELLVTAQDALAIIPELPELYDEPFSDSSQIPTALIARLTRHHVTVALSGDGADELFGGYNRYLAASSILSKTARIPLSIRRRVADKVNALPDTALDFLGRPLGMAETALKMRKFANVLAARDADEYYQRLITTIRNPYHLLKARGDTPANQNPCLAISDFLHDPELRMMACDALTYLPNDILVKLDRASMGASLETRAPFLDHRVVEFALHLPLYMKIRRGRGKLLLRKVLGRYVPDELIERPKTGFAVPIGNWLSGPLKEWAEHLLRAGRLRNEGFFDAEAVRALWQEHVSGRRSHPHQLWAIVMFQAWLEREQNT